MSDSAPQLIEDFNKSLKGGKKRHGNSSLKAWVKFVKKVAKEEKLPYGAAMKRAKVRKDKGEKWMMGGVVNPVTGEDEAVDPVVVDQSVNQNPPAYIVEELDKAGNPNEPSLLGGRRRKGKSHKKHGGSKKRRGRRGTKKRRY